MVNFISEKKMYLSIFSLYHKIRGKNQHDFFYIFFCRELDSYFRIEEIYDNVLQVSNH